MASRFPSASAGRGSPPPKALPVHKAIQRVLHSLAAGDELCADAMAALCCDRAAEIATTPVPVAAPLVRSAVEAAARALCTCDPSNRTVVLATLRHLLACPSLRDVAAKASRLKSLAIAALNALPQSGDVFRADAAAAAVLQVLQEAGVDIITAGLLEKSTTPLNVAMQRSFVGAAQVLQDAGADVNQLSRDGETWPVCAAAEARSDAGMMWLLERGASLTLANASGRTITHALAIAVAADFAGRTVVAAEFCSRWLHRVIGAEASLLEARDEEGRTPLLVAAFEGHGACVAGLLELGADVAATADDWTALTLACLTASLPSVRQLIAGGAASAAALPAGSPKAGLVAMIARGAALMAGPGCGQCTARCGGARTGNCADGLDILRAVLAAGVREAVGTDGHSLGGRVGSLLCSPDASKRISAEHVLPVLQALHAAGVDVLARGPADEMPVLQMVTAANAPVLVRWLATEADAPVISVLRSRLALNLAAARCHCFAQQCNERSRWPPHSLTVP